jgi:hypothetical protein
VDHLWTCAGCLTSDAPSLVIDSRANTRVCMHGIQTILRRSGEEFLYSFKPGLARSHALRAAGTDKGGPVVHTPNPADTNSPARRGGRISRAGERRNRETTGYTTRTRIAALPQVRFHGVIQSNA